MKLPLLGLITFVWFVIKAGSEDPLLKSVTIFAFLINQTSCITDELSVDNKEWICHTCSSALQAGRVPTLSVAQNGLAFPYVPDLAADLHPLEERLVCPRQVFMTMQELLRGGQISVRGNVVSVPVDVAPTIRQLPRNISDSGTIGVKMKKRKRYKTSVFHENVRPVRGAHAVELLCETPLYKNENIQLDDEWLNRLHYGMDDDSLNAFVNNSFDPEKGIDTPFSSLQRGSMSDAVSDENIIPDKPPSETTNSPKPPNTDNPDNNASGENGEDHSNDDSESDGFSEVNVNEHNSGARDTLQDRQDYSDKTLVLAPGEDQRPSSLYHDDNAECLAFPTIYGGNEPP